jgi:hypothetical protein
MSANLDVSWMSIGVKINCGINQWECPAEFLGRIPGDTILYLGRIPGDTILNSKRIKQRPKGVKQGY